jgi:ABC-2 type transport system permease protein
MRTLRFLLQKEFKQIFRNRALLPMIFVTPIIQLIIMPLAIDYQIKNINIAIVDHDRSSYSQKLIDKIVASGYFKLASYGNSNREAFAQIEMEKADLILEIPNRFEKDLVRENHQQVFIAANAINGTTATLGSQYLGTIIANFNADVRVDWVQPQRNNSTPTIQIASSNWFNPFLNYPFFMVPGILVTLVTMIGAYTCALNIVKEKEIGTIEQVNVTPIKKYHFILGKMIPFWLIGNLVFSIGFFVVARLIYGIVPAGSIPLVYAFLGIFLTAVLGIGLLISTYSETQQQAMSLAFFCMMIFMLMSGLFTSVDSMPGWAKIIAQCSPVTHFVEVMRMVVLKGSGFSDIKTHFAAMTGFAVLFNGWAILNYRKTN